MKLYYWKQLLIALTFSLAIFLSQFLSTVLDNPTAKMKSGGNVKIQPDDQLEFRSGAEQIESDKIGAINWHINEALEHLGDGVKSKSQDKTWIGETQKNLETALDVLNDSRIEGSPNNMGQSIRSTFYPNSIVRGEQNPSETKRFDIGSVLTLLASFIAMVATISTILLSWRKDIREAKAEIRRLEADRPRIHIP